MTPDELDELVGRSLRESAAASGADAGRLGEIVRRGRVRRRRRQTVVGATAALAIVLAGAAFVSTRAPDRQNVIVGDESTSSAPVASAATSAAGPTTAPGTPRAPVTATVSVTAAAGAPLAAAPGAIEFVSVHGESYQMWSSGALLGVFTPCRGVASPCDVPVVANGGDHLVYIERDGDGATRVMSVPVTGGDPAVVLVPAGGSSVIDISPDGDALYVVEAGGANLTLDGTAKTRRGRLSRLEDGRRTTIADNVSEVAAAPNGRLAYATPDGIVVSSAATIDPSQAPPIGGLGSGPIANGITEVSQLSWAPSSSLLLFNGGSDERYLLDAATARSLADAHGPIGGLACWLDDGMIGSFESDQRASSGAAITGALVDIDARTRERRVRSATRHATKQIACTSDGSVALVDVAAGTTAGRLLVVHADGSSAQLGTGYTRVRSLR